MCSSFTYIKSTYHSEFTLIDELCSGGKFWLKPILHPISDLEKEIEVNGEKFIPIAWLRVNICEELSYSKTGFSDFETYKEKELHLSIYDIFSYELTLSEIVKIIEKLYEWHFDIHNLIEKDMAININNLK